ncbi:MAG TPA: pilus assembly protein TadG-related protein [Terriglobales bacterium]|nr:pilus assembly protein TadG-related protein [Terriglobales bacterium]
MRRIQTRSGRSRESGIVILLVAVVLLFVVGAMAALAIDVVSLYTARSEAQLAADAAALAGARVLANSGMTSDPSAISDGLVAAAESLATTIATQVARHNEVGGRNLTAAEVVVTYNDTDPTFVTNPRVTVRTTRTDLPTFFARIWGNSTLAVAATAIAEAYNPSGAGLPPLAGPVTPVAPICVKPWLLPNISPTPGSGSTLPIFDPVTGAIQDSLLLGWQTPTTGPPPRLRLMAGSTTPAPWGYYPGDPTIYFPAPSAASVACAGSTGFTPYQLSVAGCVRTPIACDSFVGIDTLSYPTRDAETAGAVNCLTHSTTGGGDSVDTASPPSPPFQFLAGADNPVVQAGTITAGTDILVSDSLVTVPVVNIPPSATTVTTPVQVIGFVQLFLNFDGADVPTSPPLDLNHIQTKTINLAGCGTGATGTPILGNGASAVPVRLVTPP